MLVTYLKVKSLLEANKDHFTLRNFIVRFIVQPCIPECEKLIYTYL